MGGSDLPGHIARKLVHEVAFSEAANFHRIVRRFQRVNCLHGCRCFQSQLCKQALIMLFRETSAISPAAINLGTCSLECIKIPLVIHFVRG